MDHLTVEKRSWNMSRITSKNTKPEIIVRSMLHGMGFRFRLHRKDLPGKPYIVLPEWKTVIFVHGCFRHRHEEFCCGFTGMKEGKYMIVRHNPKMLHSLRCYPVDCIGDLKCFRK
jgi:DNA mismatch endonuclease Vsr